MNNQPKLFDVPIVANNGAKFSECGKYRYALWRIWDETKPLVMFVGLNPSTADVEKDDPTINRVTQISKNLNYGGFYMMNLFALVTPYREELIKSVDPIGDNDKYLRDIAGKCSDYIFAWGAFKEAKDRSLALCKIIAGSKPKALIINKDGSPRHPLYVPVNTKPRDYENRPNFDIADDN